MVQGISGFYAGLRQVASERRAGGRGRPTSTDTKIERDDEPMTSASTSRLVTGGRDERVATLEQWILAAAREWEPVRGLYRPYVEGLENLPADGRFLLVANHTFMAATEILLIPYEVHRRIGRKVRPLTDRGFANMGGLQRDVLSAAGAVVGTPDAARELMRANEPILVFPGGAREISKGKDELYTLLWQDRAGFARLAVEHNYPIITAGVVGGDDVYKILTTRRGRWGRLACAAGQSLTGRSDMVTPLVRGLGPTLIPRPQRLYARFSAPIDTTAPKDIQLDQWVATVKSTVKADLEGALADLQKIRATDPFRHLSPWAWQKAAEPQQ
jgi:1-acyl-sn-glycerol-3-phosphate acyltransferase